MVRAIRDPKITSTESIKEAHVTRIKASIAYCNLSKESVHSDTTKTFYGIAERELN